jgi:hypothetical protein
VAMSERPGFIKFEFRYGWCTLSLQGAGGEHRAFKATRIVNSFDFLLKAFLDIAGGRNCSAAIWAGEGSGVFIDLAAPRPERIAIVVHRMRFSEYIAADDDWLPVREGVELAISVAARDVWIELAQELRRVRAEYADSAGHMDQWGWAFPDSCLERIEQVAERF